MTYRIKRVDNTDEEVVHTIREMHDATFGNEAPQITDKDFDEGFWWLSYLSQTREPVAFAGLTKSLRYDNVGYLCRVGVLSPHRGKGLQRRLIRVREAQAKRNGWVMCITDTTNNPASANSLIKAGYRTYKPPVSWGLSSAIYWRKWL